MIRARGVLAAHVVLRWLVLAVQKLRQRGRAIIAPLSGRRGWWLLQDCQAVRGMTRDETHCWLRKVASKMIETLPPRARALEREARDRKAIVPVMSIPKFRSRN